MLIRPRLTIRRGGNYMRTRLEGERVGPESRARRAARISSLSLIPGIINGRLRGIPRGLPSRDDWRMRRKYSLIIERAIAVEWLLSDHRVYRANFAPLPDSLHRRRRSNFRGVRKPIRGYPTCPFSWFPFFIFPSTDEIESARVLLPSISLSLYHSYSSEIFDRVREKNWEEEGEGL